MNPILELQAAMSAANGRLAALEKSQREMLASQQAALEETAALRGIFSSVETHLVRLFEEDTAMKARVEKVESRVDALERRPPAA